MTDAIALFVLLTVCQGAPPGPAGPEEATEAQETEVEGIVLRYRALPWAARHALTAPASGTSDPAPLLALGQLELKRAARLGGERLEPGHYGIFCHGLLGPGARPVLRLARLPGPAPLGGEMADLARVEVTSRPPIRFDLAAGTTPALRITVSPSRRGVSLTVEYGNRRAVTVLRR